MARKNDNLLRVLFDCPWWVSVLVSICSYILLTEIVPVFLPNSDSIYTKPFTEGITNGLEMIAPVVAIIFLIPAPFAFLRSFSIKQRYQATSTKDDLNGLNWIQFEGLLGEFYRQQGYQVKQNFSQQPDGGVDIELTKFGKVSLVQCKHWKARKVGVKVIREMYGILLDRKADKMIIATSGEFTLEAQRFAQGKGLELINGSQLISMLAQAKNPAIETTEPIEQQLLNSETTTPSTSLICPRCNSELILRTAKRGTNAGMQFYGCSGFPRCRYTLNS